MKDNRSDKAQFMVRIDKEIGENFKKSIKQRGQSVQFILEKAILKYIDETKQLESHDE